jgi:hypothetical protein
MLIFLNGLEKSNITKTTHYCQQLEIRCVRSTNNETPVERNRSLEGTMELS